MNTQTLEAIANFIASHNIVQEEALKRAEVLHRKELQLARQYFTAANNRCFGFEDAMFAGNSDVSSKFSD
jgi:hypothetical protein